jgi:molecular chaperone DnaK (HSP70)
MKSARGWAIDLGTTNTSVARWHDAEGQPRVLELAAVCRNAGPRDPMDAGRLVPSAVDLDDRPGLVDRLGAWPVIERSAFLGRCAVIGRQALERNAATVRASFVPTFKPGLSTEPLRPLARLGDEPITARRAAHRFLRELLREIKVATGERPRSSSSPHPSRFSKSIAPSCSGFSAGSASVPSASSRAGAAAIGYGLSSPRTAPCW